MDLCNELSLSGWSAGKLPGKNVYTGHYTQTFQPIFFIPTMVTGTMDFCHFILLSLTLIWGRGKGRVEGVTRLRFLAHFSNDQGRI